MDNFTIFTEFLLIDISTTRELQVLQGLMFLVFYLGALTGNILTLTAIVINPHLLSLMYYFVGNLSFIDLCCISVALHNMIVNSLSGNKSTSLLACAFHIYLFILFVAPELAFLVVMSSLCCHLPPSAIWAHHYPTLCTQAAGGLWTTGLVYSVIHTVNMFRLSFIGFNVIHQYFCDVPQILRISSSNVWFSEFMDLTISTCVILVCSAFLFKSYIDIFSMVFKMRSVEARNKALSTCTPQLAILILFLISLLSAVFGSMANEPSLGNLLMAMFYFMVPSFLNPIIYNLWNREINIVLCRMFHRYFEFLKKIF